MAATSPVALNQSWASWRNGDYTLLNNVWGTPEDQRDKPGSQISITAASGADVRSGVTMQWDLPGARPAAGVWGYPEIYWGGQFGQAVPALTTTVDNLQSLTVTYAVRAAAGFDVLIELYTTNDAGQPTNEIGVIVHGGDGRGAGTYADGDITAVVNLNAQGASAARYILYQSVADKLSGTINFANILADLTAKGLVNPRDHVSGLELGAEMPGGSGVLQVDRFAVFEAVKTPHLITQTGAAAGQVFDITTNNDYVIDGGAAGAGSAVVRLDAAFAASRVGVSANGHLNVTHPLYGAIDLTRIGEIQFADHVVTAAGLPAPTAGNDVLQTTADVREIHAGAGNDILAAAAAGGAYLRGDDGDDSLAGAAGFDDLNGNKGADTVSGGTGGDWVLGGQDNDLLRGDDGDDIVNGNLGDDRCEGGAGNDTVRGGQGDDLILGQGGDDWLSGDRGNDTLSGGAGADLFHTFAEAGIDRVTDFNRAEGDRVLVDAGLAYTVAQAGADVVVTVAGQAQLVLVGVQTAQLTGDWIFSQ